METRSYNVYVADCPSRQVLDLVSDKWTVLIVNLLVKRPYRFGELRRAIGGISQEMLTQTLRNLARDGLVGRRVFPSVPVTVECSLTALGETLSGPLAVICSWAEDHMDSVHVARASYQAPPPVEQPRSTGGQRQ